MARSNDWDAAMAARLRAGDDSALAAVYDQYGSLVHGIAVRLVGAGRAMDITQEVFLNLWLHPDRYDPGQGSLRTFLAVVSRRRAIDDVRQHTRRQAREQRAEQQRAGDPGPTAVPNVEEAALAMIAGDRIRRAVDRLPVEQRRAIELAYFDGLTYREVAMATESPEGTAKSRLRLGLAHLARQLGNEGHRRGEPEWT